MNLMGRRRRYEAAHTLSGQPAVYDNVGNPSLLARCKSDAEAQALASTMNTTFGAQLWEFQEAARDLGRAVLRAVGIPR